jgi:hypothetical protein
VPERPGVVVVDVVVVVVVVAGPLPLFGWVVFGAAAGVEGAPSTAGGIVWTATACRFAAAGERFALRRRVVGWPATGTDSGAAAVFELRAGSAGCRSATVGWAGFGS